MGIGDIKKIVSWLFKLKHAKDAWDKEPNHMALVTNTLKHLLYALAAVSVTALITFLQNDASLIAVLEKGGVPAAIATFLIPLSGVVIVALQNVLKHIGVLDQ